MFSWRYVWFTLRSVDVTLDDTTRRWSFYEKNSDLHFKLNKDCPLSFWQEETVGLKLPTFYFIPTFFTNRPYKTITLCVSSNQCTIDNNHSLSFHNYTVTRNRSCSKVTPGSHLHSPDRGSSIFPHLTNSCTHLLLSTYFFCCWNQPLSCLCLRNNKVM